MRTSPCSAQLCSASSSHRPAAACLQARAHHRAGLVGRRAWTLRCNSNKAKVTLYVPVDTQLGEEVAVAGSVPELGSWDSAKAPALKWTPGSVWTSVIELPTGKNIEYKFIKKRGQTVVQWQPGSNMQISLPDGTLQAEVRDTWTGAHESMQTLGEEDMDAQKEAAEAAVAALKAQNQTAQTSAGAPTAGKEAAATATKASSSAPAAAAASSGSPASSSSPSASSNEKSDGASPSSNIVPADGILGGASSSDAAKEGEVEAEPNRLVAVLGVLGVLGIGSGTALLISLKMIPGLALPALPGLV